MSSVNKKRSRQDESKEKKNKPKKQKKSGTTKKMKKEKKKRTGPKRSLSAYMFFVKVERPRLHKAEPDLAFGDLGKAVGTAWKQLSEADRQPFVKQAVADKERYLKEKENWKEEKKESDREEENEETDDEEEKVVVKKKKKKSSKKKAQPEAEAEASTDEQSE